jgi:hypothetical protein
MVSALTILSLDEFTGARYGGRDGQRTSQITTCLAACATYLLSPGQAQAI